jgi:hypothetical protein
MDVGFEVGREAIQEMGCFNDYEGGVGDVSWSRFRHLIGAGRKD